MSPNVALIGLAFGLSIVGFGCSSDDNPTNTGNTGDGGTTPDGSGGGETVKQTGKIVKYQPCATALEGVEGATVEIGSRSVKSDADGAYAIDVDKGAPFSMKVTNPGYFRVIEGETTISANFERGETRLISNSIAGLLLGGLPGFDIPADQPDGGIGEISTAIITLEALKTGACASREAATVTLDPPEPDAKIQYPANCASPAGDVMKDDPTVFPSAVIYNLPPGKTYKVTITSPACDMVAYPYDYQGLTWTGNVTTQPGNGVSFIRTFLTK